MRSLNHAQRNVNGVVDRQDRTLVGKNTLCACIFLHIERLVSKPLGFSPIAGIRYAMIPAYRGASPMAEALGLASMGGALRRWHPRHRNPVWVFACTS